MGIKRKNKVSAEFSMSSLTDIIFLLLIFFMLTSSLVAPNALNLKLPGTTRDRIPTEKKMDNVRISKSGKFYLNGSARSIKSIESYLSKKAKSRSSELNITIAPDKGVPTEYVVEVMNIALRYNINAILAAEE